MQGVDEMLCEFRVSANMGTRLLSSQGVLFAGLVLFAIKGNSILGFPETVRGREHASCMKASVISCWHPGKSLLWSGAHLERALEVR